MFKRPTVNMRIFSTEVQEMNAATLTVRYGHPSSTQSAEDTGVIHSHVSIRCGSIFIEVFR